MPDAQPLATETIPEIVALIEELIAVRARVRGRRRRLLPRRELRELRRALGPAARPGRGAGAEPAQGGSARLRALEGDQGGRGHLVGVAVGRRPSRAGTSSARRWPRRSSGPEFWIHGGGLDLVFPHHENERAQSQAVGHPFARIWMHNGMLRFTGEKMSKSVGNVETIRDVLDEWGRGDGARLLPDRRTGASRSTSRRRRWRLRARRRRRFRNALRGETRAAGDWERARRRRSRTTSTRPPPSRSCTSGRATGALDELRRGLALFGLGVARRHVEAAPAEVVALARGPGGRPGREGTSPRPTGSATRSRPPAGRCATWPTRRASSSCRAA